MGKVLSFVANGSVSASICATESGPESLLQQRPALTTMRLERTMADKPLPPPELLRQLLRYDPATGVLVWLPRSPELFEDGAFSATQRARVFNGKNAGKEAFTAPSHGYRVGRIFDVMHPAHRVIWAMQTGQWPTGDIDHIDGDRSNNRWGNLRDVPHAVNNQNMKRAINNTSGCTGVSWCKRSGHWETYIGDGKNRERLGCFANLEDAVFARKSAERIRGYHPNHDRAAA